MAADLSVRVATPEDERLVSELLKASYPALMPHGYDEATLKATLKATLPLITQANPALLSSGKYYLVVSESRHIVGSGGWSLERPGSGENEQGLAHIRHFATHSEWVGRGIGRAIYARCEKDAHLAGARRFECYASLNAEGFYAALGFKPVRRIEVEMGVRLKFPSLLMERLIL